MSAVVGETLLFFLEGPSPLGVGEAGLLGAPSLLEVGEPRVLGVPSLLEVGEPRLLSLPEMGEPRLSPGERLVPLMDHPPIWLQACV